MFTIANLTLANDHNENMRGYGAYPPETGREGSALYIVIVQFEYTLFNDRYFVELMMPKRPR